MEEKRIAAICTQDGNHFIVVKPKNEENFGTYLRDNYNVTNYYTVQIDFINDNYEN